MAHYHFMMDAYNCPENSSNNPMVVYELLNSVCNKLNLKPVMPPFLVPYYYCEDGVDIGVSAFTLCEGGHITIHTFPYRSCYFVDVLTDEFFSKNDAEHAFLDQIYAKDVNSRIIDRRMIYQQKDEEIDPSLDFGPHFMIEVDNFKMDMDYIFTWLDTVAERINMTAISRPYVLYDKDVDPEYISGILVVAQSHIAVHYNIKEKKALIDIFSCAFLDKEKVSNLFSSYFGDKAHWKLYSRGSKHIDSYKRKAKRISESKLWLKNYKK